MLLLVILLCILRPTASKDINHLIEATESGDNAEFYHTEEGNKYGVMLEKVPFSEAKIICKSKRGELLELLDTDVAKFIAMALAESAVGFAAAWIGGEYTPAISVTSTGSWSWLSGAAIPTIPLKPNVTYPLNELPFWVDKPNLTNNNSLCLTMTRNNHHLPIITGMECKVKRPFICSLPSDEGVAEPRESQPPIRCNAKVFHVYEAQLTWNQALSFCRLIGYNLATVTTTEEFDRLTVRMKRTRPIIENMWIGGVFEKGKWRWVSNNEEIGVSSINTEKSVAQALPWNRPNNIIFEGCLLADRHICDKFAYVEAKCNRRRNFICQEEKKSSKRVMLKVNDYFISTVKLPWNDAQRKCSTCLTGGALMDLDVSTTQDLDEKLKSIFTAMTSEFGTEVRHIWLNGYLQPSEGSYAFKWKTDETQVGGTELKTDLYKNSSNGENGYVIYCQESFSVYRELVNYKCLNLDRENLKQFFMYGLNCDYKQHFICTGQKKKAKRSANSNEEPSLHVVQADCSS